MSIFFFFFCVIASVYTLIYGLDVCFNIYLHRSEEDEEEEDLPEYVKRMYA